jgi:polygalacturonase
MSIVTNAAKYRRETRRGAGFNKPAHNWRHGLKVGWITGVAALAPAIFACKPAVAGNPNDFSIDLPNIGATVYNVTLPNGGIAGASIDGGAVADANGSSFNNTTVLNDFLAYAASHGGGTVEIPAAASAYGTDELLIGNNVNLDVASGATLQNLSTKSTFINTLPGTSHDVEISGGGIINDNATSTSSNHMCILGNITNLEVTNVTIENSSEEHLVAEGDSNVLINNVTIQDSKIQANTDGIDFAGTNFLIENCNISDGDDDIVAKPDTVPCANIYITNDNITDGHGISIGGQTNAGLNGMYVNNCTLNMASASNAVGIHLKAGDPNGGLVQNVTYNDITINNVDDGIYIDSQYNSVSGDDSPTDNQPSIALDSTAPVWNNITFNGINISNSTSSSAKIYGLNSTPVNMTGLNFENITTTSTKDPWDMYYSNDTFMNNVNVDGVAILDAEGNYKDGSGDEQSQEADDTFSTSPEFSAYTVDLPTLVPAPEPGTLTLIGGATGLILMRRKQRRVNNRI